MLQQVYSTYLPCFFSGQMLRTSQYTSLQASYRQDAVMNQEYAVYVLSKYFLHSISEGGG